MPLNINSASRVYKILIDAQKLPDDHKVIDVWSSIFAIEESNKQKKSFEVSRCLGLLHEEMNAIETAMDVSGYSGDLYKPYINRATNVIAVHSIMGAWKGLKSHLAPEVLLSLKFCMEILPDEELELDQKKLDEILKLVVDLETELDSAEIPSHLRNIITKNLSQIKEAIHSYGIVGVKALQDVMQSAYGEVVINEKVFVDAADYVQVGKLGNVWRKIQSVSDGVIKLEKGVKSSAKIIEYGSKAVEFLDSVFPNM